jgi:1-phosphofructokinase family hexose kinase
MAEQRIVTITLNPAVDRVLEAPGFAVGKHVRGKRVALHPAGKGVNVSRVLALLGIRSIATGFVGQGELGMFEEHLEETGHNRVICQLLIVRARTRDNVTIVDPIEDTETHVRDEGFEVQPEDVARIASKLALLSNEDTLMVFAGSLPPGVSPGAFSHMVDRCNERGARIVVDTSVPGLADMREAAAWMLKLNREELAAMAEMPTESEAQVLEACKALFRRGKGRFGHILATMGADGAILYGETVRLRGRVGVHPGRIVSTVGCGDCMVAGVIAGHIRSGDWTVALREGLAAATAGATERRAGFINTEDVEEFREAAIVEPLEG